MQKENKLKHRIEFMIFKAYILKVKILPHFFIKLDRVIVLFLFRLLSKKHSNIVNKNLKIVFPHYSAEQISSLKIDVYSHYSRIFLEIIYLLVKKQPNKTLLKITNKNLEKISEVLSKNKGAIIFSAHFGNWELIPFILHKELNKTIHSIARKMDNPLIENYVAEFRKYMGSEIIYKDKAIRAILTLLEKNEIIYLLIDQNTITREGVIVDFFGKKVTAITSVAQLHLKKDIPVIPAFIHYKKNEIVFEVLDEVVFNKGANHNENVQQLTQVYTNIIEQNIKKSPCQWFWFHNRWKDSIGESND